MAIACEPTLTYSLETITHKKRSTSSKEAERIVTRHRSTRTTGQPSALDAFHVQRVEAFRSLLRIKLNLVIVLKRTVDLYISDVRRMDEYVLRAIVWGNKAKPFLGTKPFDSSLWHIGVGVDECTVDTALRSISRDIQ